MNTNMAIGAPSSVELSQLLKTADAKDVQIRAILELLRENDCASRYIEGLASGNCAAVRQRDHQKLLIVSNRDGLVAFCGGVDIEGGRSNWHDVHCRIRGRAAGILYDLFVQRWQMHPDIIKKPASKRDVRKPPGTKTAGDKHVQVVRTYPAAYRDRFPGLPAAEHTVYDLIGNAISASKRFIYLEDQYLIANSSMRFGGEPISSCLPTSSRTHPSKRWSSLLRGPSGSTS